MRSHAAFVIFCMIWLTTQLIGMIAMGNRWPGVEVNFGATALMFAWTCWLHWSKE